MIAGAPYRPSNGTEGMIFMEAFCDRCAVNHDGDCEILAASFMGQVPEWLHDEHGLPCCTAFKAVIAARKEKP